MGDTGSLFLGFVFSALQIFADLRNERRNVDVRFGQALNSFEEPAFQAAYGLDRDLAETVVRGLFQQIAIFEVKIVDNFGDTMAIESRARKRGALKWLSTKLFGDTKTYSVPLQATSKSFRSGFHAGDLTIRVDTYIIAETFFQRSGLILIFGLLRNLFLAVILATLFHYLLSRPLRHVAKLIKDGRGDIQIPSRHEQDELGALVQAHNDLSHKKGEAEVRFREFAELGADWFWELDDQLRFTFVSGNISKFGAEPEHFIGKTAADLVGEETALSAGWAEELQALNDHMSFKDSEKPSTIGVGKWVQSNGAPKFDADGRFLGYRGATVDITERKQAEAALRESNQRFQDLAEGSLQGILVHRNLKPLYANESLCRIFGYESVDDILALESITELSTGVDGERIRDRALQRTAGDVISTLSEFEGRRADGTVIWFETSGRTIQWDGEEAIQATVMDITERRIAEKALRDSEERFRSVFEKSHVGMAIHDTTGRLTTVNQAFADMLDRSREEVQQSRDSDFTHPDDITESAKILERWISGDAEQIQFEKRYLRADGSVVWTINNITAVELEGQGKVFAITQVLDISEQRQAEASQRRSEELFRTAFETSFNGNIMIDSDGVIELFNTAAQKMFGYTVEEVIGRNVRMLMPAQDANAHDSYL
ncbi:MAG TPA: PAS domain S-box protein, partial [Sneathiellales bacterium]|nr:PAS domain S-box protein [Sneathiellales bacterium]